MVLDWDVKLVSHNNLVVCHTRDDEALDTIEMSGFAIKQFGHTVTIEADNRAVVAHILKTRGFKVAE